MDKAIFVLWLSIVALPVLYASSQHGHWIDTYFGGGGIQCCKAGRDCAMHQVRLLSQNRDSATVEIDAVRYDVRQDSLHLSEDLHDWVCWKGGTAAMGEPAREPRCVFIAPGT